MKRLAYSLQAAEHEILQNQADRATAIYELTGEGKKFKEISERMQETLVALRKE